MEQGEQEGMQTFDGVIEQMIRQGIVTKETALPYASNANNLLLRLADFGGASAKPAAPPTEPKSGPDSMLDMIER
jgi:Tfp pilus assembly ATPase PilU